MLPIRSLPVPKTLFPDAVLAKQMDTLAHRRMASSGYLSSYWKLARSMQHKGLLPLVHGQSQTFRISYEALKVLGFRNGQLLRAPSHDFFEQSAKSLAQLPYYQKKGSTLLCRMLQKIPSPLVPTELSGRVDHMPTFAPFLLSSTLGLGGLGKPYEDHWSRAYDEFGLSFVFGQPAYKLDTDTKGNRSRSDEVSEQIVKDVICNAMKQRGYSPERIEDFAKDLPELFTEAKKLEYGQLLVIGVTAEQAIKWAYVSREYGVPTGRSMKEVLDDYSQNIIPKKAYQTRLMLTKESLDPEQGVQVVNLMDEQAVENFCEGTPAIPLSQEEELQKVLSSSLSLLKYDRSPLQTFQNKIAKALQDLK